MKFFFIVLFFLGFLCCQLPTTPSNSKKNTDSVASLKKDSAAIKTREESLSIKPDSVSQHIIDSILQFTQSPYFMDYGTPGALQATAVQINSLGVMFGLNKIDIPVTPAQDNYFNMLKESLAQSTVNNLNYTDELCAFVDAFFEEDSKKASTSADIIEQLCKFTMSAKMKAVRERDGERVRIFSAINKQCNDAKKYVDVFSKLLFAAGTLKDCLKIIIRAMEPLSTFTGAEVGLQYIIDSSDSLSGELKGAMQDIITMLKDINSTFLINLKNGNSELVKIITDFTQKLYEDNKEQINKVVLNMIGSKNYKFLTEFDNARSFFKSISEPVFPAENMLTQIQPAYSFTMLENGIHKAIFENIKTNKYLSEDNQLKYIQSFKILLLVEASAYEKLAAFFYSVKSLGKQNEDNAQSFHKTAGYCLDSFNAINL